MKHPPAMDKEAFNRGVDEILYFKPLRRALALLFNRIKNPK